MPVTARRRLPVTIIFVAALLLIAATGGRDALAATQMPRAALPGCGGPNVTIPTGGSAAVQSAAVTTAIQNVVGQLGTLRTKSNLASVSVAAVYDQDLVFAASAGCADLDQQTPATPQTIYMMGSVTKVFTATMLMQLRDAGLLSLDDQVSQYVPQVQYVSPEGALVSPTFRQLADYSSGLPRTLNPEPPSPAALLQQLSSVQALSDPGAAYLYSNLGFATLGQALASMAGTPYEQYVEQNILQPLGMNSSIFVPDPSNAGLVATGYTQLRGSGANLRWTPIAAAQRGAFDPGGGLLSSTTDMAKFLSFQFRGDSTVLSLASRQEMYQPLIPAAATDSGAAQTGLYAGIGWFNFTTNPTPAVAKDGVWAGFSSYILVFPERKLGIVVAENMDNDLLSGPTAPGQIATMVANAIGPALRSR